MSNPASDASNTNSAGAGELIRRQAAASADLNNATTFREIAVILARYLLEDEQFIAMSVFEYDTDGTLSGIHTTTSANRHDVFEGDLYVAVTPDSGGPLLRALIETSQPVLFEDVATYVADYPALESWYAEHGIRSTLLIPLMDDHVYGYVSLNSVGALITPDEDQLAVYRTLVNQVSALLRANHLLETHQETNILYNLSQELIAAQDSMDILRALREHVAPDADTLLMTNIGWDADTRTPNRIEMEAIIDERGEIWLERDMLPRTEQDTLDHLQAEWADYGGTVMIIEDFDRVIDARPDLRHGYEQGFRSSVSIYITDGKQVTQQITISYNQPRHYSERTRRLYNSVLQQLEAMAENQRLVRDTQITAVRLGSQVRVLQTLNDLSTNMPTAENENVLATMICQALVSALHIHHASVVVIDDNRQTAHLAGEYPEMIGSGREIPLDNALQQAVIQEKHPVIVRDIHDDPHIPAEMAAYLETQGVQKMALLPLVDSRGNYMGTVGMDIRDNIHNFTTDVMDIAQNIASQTAVALQNILLLRRTQRQAQQLQQVANFGQAAQATFDIGDMLNMALTYAGDILNAERYSVLLYDKEIDGLREVAFSEDKMPVVKMFAGDVISRDGTTAGKVWETAQPLYVEDFQTRDDHLRHSTRDDACSAMSIPVFLRGTVQGMVEIATTVRNAYTLSDGAILQQLVNQLAVAIENAEAYTQNQRIATSKAQVNEITNQLQRQTEIDRLMHVTVSELGKVLGAKRARIRLGKPEKDS